MISKHLATKKLDEYLLTGLPIREFNVKPCSVEKDWFAKYIRVRQEFIESLADNMEDLIFFNFPQDVFMDLLMGSKIPENISIRLRVPLVWGGKLEIDNMFLCRTFNDSHNMDKFIISQSAFQTVWLPDPAKKVYMSTNIGGAGDGGNSAEDRMTQIAMQQAASKGRI